MEPVGNMKGNSLFTKVGVLSTLLPYYSMELDKWYVLLWKLWKGSREFYEGNYRLLNNVYKTVETDQHEIMIKLIKKYVNPDIPLDRRFALFLNCNAKKDNVLAFCRKVGSLAKTQLMNLFVVGIHKLSEEELKVVDSFLLYCISHELLTITFIFKKTVMEEIPPGMISSMKYPTETVNITWLDVKPYTFKQLIEASKDVKCLKFWGGSFEDLPEDFSLDKNKTYTIRKIDFAKIDIEDQQEDAIIITPFNKEIMVKAFKEANLPEEVWKDFEKKEGEEQ